MVEKGAPAAGPSAAPFNTFLGSPFASAMPTVPTMPPLMHPAYRGQPQPPLGAFLGDMSSTQALLEMVRNASGGANDAYLKGTPDVYLKGVPPAALTTAPSKRLVADVPTSPLDLSSTVLKRPKLEDHEHFPFDASVSPPSPPRHRRPHQTPSPSSSASSGGVRAGRPALGTPCAEPQCPNAQNIAHWGVEDVCAFVSGIDLCADYVEVSNDGLGHVHRGK